MRAIRFLPIFFLLSAVLPASPASAECLVNTPDSVCSTSGTCTLNALGSTCDGACDANLASPACTGSCTVNVGAYCQGDCVINASIFTPVACDGACTVNVDAFCQGDCTVNANGAVCDSFTADCAINMGACLSDGNCLVNEGFCENNADCLINLGYCGGAGNCVVNVSDPTLGGNQPPGGYDCAADCTINYGANCAVARCDEAILSLYQDLIVDDLELCL